MRYGHSVAQGIISSVKERRTDLLILGWQGNTRWEQFAMGSTLDPVIEQAPCDILVVTAGRPEPDKEITRILFPSKGKSPHAELALTVVSLLAKRFDAEVTILHVTPNATPESEARTLTATIAGHLSDVKHSVHIIEGEDIAASIIRESHTHDVVVIGATTENIFQQLLFGLVPQKIATQCSKTVLMVKKDLGIRSWFRRWFV